MYAVQDLEVEVHIGQAQARGAKLAVLGDRHAFMHFCLWQNTVAG